MANEPWNIDETAKRLDDIKAIEDPVEQVKQLNQEAESVIRLVHLHTNDDFSNPYTQSAVDLFKGNGFEDHASIVKENLTNTKYGVFPWMDEDTKGQRFEDIQVDFNNLIDDAEVSSARMLGASEIVSGSEVGATRENRPDVSAEINALVDNALDEVDGISFGDVQGILEQASGGEEGLLEARQTIAGDMGIDLEDVPDISDFSQSDISEFIRESGAEGVISSIPEQIAIETAKIEEQLPQIMKDAIQPHLDKAAKLKGLLSGDFSMQKDGSNAIMAVLAMNVEKKFPENADAIMSRLGDSREALGGVFHAKLDSSNFTKDVTDAEDLQVSSAMSAVVNSAEFRQAMQSDPEAAIQGLSAEVGKQLEEQIDTSFKHYLPREAVVEATAAEASAQHAVAVQAKYEQYSSMPDSSQDRMLKMMERQAVRNPEDHSVQADIDALQKLVEQRDVAAPAVQGLEM